MSPWDSDCVCADVVAPSGPPDIFRIVAGRQKDPQHDHGVEISNQPNLQVWEQEVEFSYVAVR